MASVNKVIVLGNLGRDPEVRYMANGNAVADISIATSRTWKDKNSGEKMEETEWHRVTAFGRTAEVIGEYCAKGKPLYVEGYLKTEKWQDKDGNDRYTTKIIANSIQLLGFKESGDNDNRGGDRQQRAPAPAPRAAAPRAPAAGHAPKPQTGFDDMDDDIPF